MKIKEIRDNQWLGVPEKPVRPRTFRAGKLTMEFVEGRVLNVRASGKKLVDEVYFALRDYNWGTIPYDMEDIDIEEAEDSFRITFKAVHNWGEIQFQWEGTVTGRPESVIEYSFHGQARGDFLRNRIGFCVLHPAGCAGMDCEVEHFLTGPEKGTLPDLICPRQPFVDIKSITHYPTEGMALKVAFEGDIFEMEDQRNWTDASFKTYCTPLSLPFPTQVCKGDQIRQSVTLMLLEDGSFVEAAVQEEGVVAMGEIPLREKGISLGSCITRPLSELQIQRAAALGLSHLRLDYHFRNGDRGRVMELFQQAKILETNVILALFFTDQWENEVERLNAFLSESKNQISGMLIFQEGVGVISQEILDQIRRSLKEWNIPMGSGTDAFFTQINRQRLARESMDFISYSNNPQVHAFDNTSIMSTTEGQRANLKSCAALYPGLPVWVSPITFRMRWNPDATGREIRRTGELPSDVDPRQMSLFGASWFLRSVAACIEGGAAGMTCFELTGSKGLMEEAEPERDYRFPAAPDMLYPLYFAFYGLRNLTSYRAGVRISEAVTAIVLRGEQNIRLILANPRGSSVKVQVENRGAPAWGIYIAQKQAIELAQKETFSTRDPLWHRLDLTNPVVLEPYAILIAEY